MYYPIFFLTNVLEFSNHKTRTSSGAYSDITYKTGHDWQRLNIKNTRSMYVCMYVCM